MIYVISPHIDDAVLSIGGTIDVLLKSNRQVTIEYVFTISNWTNPDAIVQAIYPIDAMWVTALRKHEELNVSRWLGHQCSFLDFDDYPLRNSDDISNTCSLIDRICSHVFIDSRMNDIFLFPMSEGLKHPDHELIRSIGDRGVDLGFIIGYYEDLPYAARYLNTHRLTVKKMVDAGYYSQSFEIDIELKELLIRCYESQISEEWIGCIRSYSYCLPTNNYFERIWLPNGIEKLTKNV